jgi:hypothetical protein
MLNISETSCDWTIKNNLSHFIKTNEILEKLNLSNNNFGDFMCGVIDGSA